MTASPPTSRRPHPSHRQPRPRPSRMVVAGGAAAALVVGLGIAVSTGAVPTPLTASTASSAPSDVVLASMPPTAQPSAGVNGRGYTLATVPASWAAAHLPKPKPKPRPTPTVTPTPAMTHSAPAQPSVLEPLATAENQTPTGQNQLAWSEAILRALGAPLTSANILSIGYWMQNEAGSPPSGIVGENNPINVSQACCGGIPIQDDGDGVTFLRSYPTVADGIQATAEYLNNGSFDGIVAALKQGIGLMNNSSLASEISEYSGDGYSTIPDSWGQSQGQPLT